MSLILNNYIIKSVQFLFFGSFFAIGLYLLQHQVYADGLHGYPSDIQEHIKFLKLFFEGKHYIPHPLWHSSVKIVSSLSSLSIEASAVIVTSLYIVTFVYIVYRLTKLFLKNLQTKNNCYHEAILLTTTFIIVVIGPFYLPFYERIIYSGQGSPNIWHNVTYWTVKPIALLTIYFSVRTLQFFNFKYALIALLTALVSIIAKPSFILIFMPSIILLTLSRYRIKRNIYFVALLTISVFAVLLYQFLHKYGGDSKIIIDFLGVWSLKSRSIGISIIFAIAFPSLFLLLYQNAIKNDFVLLSWLQFLFGVFLYAIFAEEGNNYMHGNFGWSYMLSLSFLYLFSIIEFIKYFHMPLSWKQIILSILLCYQTWVGLYYLIKVLQGQNPLYIAIFL